MSIPTKKVAEYSDKSNALKNCPEIPSLFDRKPQTPASQTPARIQNTIACGFGSNRLTEIRNLFRDNSKVWIKRGEYRLVLERESTFVRMVAAEHVRKCLSHSNTAPNTPRRHQTTDRREPTTYQSANARIMVKTSPARMAHVMGLSIE